MSRLPRFVTPLLAVVALSIPVTSRAQAPDPPDAPTNPGRVSIGLNGGVLLGPSQGILVAGPNITFNASRKRALQISTSLARTEDSLSQETWLMYAVQYRRTVGDTGDSRRYWSVGGVGLIDHERTKPQTYTFSGSRSSTSVARTRTFAVLPVVPVAGFGVEKYVRPRLAIRGDVVISFLVVRAAVGVSVPIGRLQ